LSVKVLWRTKAKEEIKLKEKQQLLLTLSLNKELILLWPKIGKIKNKKVDNFLSGKLH
jgi:hypothetical protein